MASATDELFPCPKCLGENVVERSKRTQFPNRKINMLYTLCEACGHESMSAQQYDVNSLRLALREVSDDNS